MTNNKDFLHDFVCDTPKEISIANSEKAFSAGRGDVQLFLQNQLRTVSNVVSHRTCRVFCYLSAF